MTVYDRTPEDKIAERIGDAEIVIMNKAPITGETIAACRNLKYIGVLATGFNVVDTEACKKAGIVVANIPTYGTDAVGQFAVALRAGNTAIDVAHHSNAVYEGRWGDNPDWCFWELPAD